MHRYRQIICSEEQNDTDISSEDGYLRQSLIKLWISKEVRNWRYQLLRFAHVNIKTNKTKQNKTKQNKTKRTRRRKRIQQWKISLQSMISAHFIHSLPVIIVSFKCFKAPVRTNLDICQFPNGAQPFSELKHVTRIFYNFHNCQQ